MVRVDVGLEPGALEVEEGGSHPIGYFQWIGCTAADAEDLNKRIRLHVAEDLGGSILEIEDFGEVTLDQLTDNVRERISADTKEPGVWYLSGRVLYNADDTGAEPGE